MIEHEHWVQHTSTNVLVCKVCLKGVGTLLDGTINDVQGLQWDVRGQHSIDCQGILRNTTENNVSHTRALQTVLPQQVNTTA